MYIEYSHTLYTEYSNLFYLACLILYTIMIPGEYGDEITSTYPPETLQTFEMG